MILLYCPYFQQPEDHWKYIAPVIGSSFVALLALYISSLFDKKKRKKDKESALRNEIYTLCERALVFSIELNYSELATVFYYHLHKVKKDEDFNMNRHYQYLTDRENANHSLQITKADLISKIQEFIHVFGDENLKIDSEKVKNKGLLIDLEGIFDNKTADEIISIQSNKKLLIPDFVKNESLGKIFIAIKDQMYPNEEKNTKKTILYLLSKLSPW